MAFSRQEGQYESGAILVIANTVREARKIAWPHCWHVEDFVDLAVRLIRDNLEVLHLVDQTKLQRNQPHVIDNPLACEFCNTWGSGLTVDKLCCNCGELPGEELVWRHWLATVW